jgi:acetyltransferase-like isoleucine patch superfamily enzyme
MNSFQNRLLLLYQRLRLIKYRSLSDCREVIGRPIFCQPAQLVGKGRIEFAGRVTLGCFPSGFFLNGYIYLEARSENSLIHIEDGVYINNNSCIVSDGAGIYIGRRSLLGTSCEIIDSDFHDLHPDRRLEGGTPKSARVVIGENVMIGSNVRILKGVHIGDNSIVSNGAVVTRSIPPNMIAFGNPARAAFGLMPEERPAESRMRSHNHA